MNERNNPECNQEETSRWLTTSQAAKRLPSVSAQTVRDWAAAGRIPGAMQLPGGRWRIPAVWVEKIMNGEANDEWG